MAVALGEHAVKGYQEEGVCYLLALINPLNVRSNCIRVWLKIHRSLEVQEFGGLANKWYANQSQSQDQSR